MYFTSLLNKYKKASSKNKKKDKKNSNKDISNLSNNNTINLNNK